MNLDNYVYVHAKGSGLQGSVTEVIQISAVCRLKRAYSLWTSGNTCDSWEVTGGVGIMLRNS